MRIPFKGIGINTRLFCWQNDLLGSDSVRVGLGLRGVLGDRKRSSRNTNATIKSSSTVPVAGLDLSKGKGGDEGKEDHKLLHD